MKEKETTLLCEIGGNLSVFHSNEAAKEKYENRSGEHEVIVLTFEEELEKYSKIIRPDLY